jgi:hypothetical protein
LFDENYLILRKEGIDCHQKDFNRKNKKPAIINVAGLKYNLHITFTPLRFDISY